MARPMRGTVNTSFQLDAKCKFVEREMHLFIVRDYSLLDSNIYLSQNLQFIVISIEFVVRNARLQHTVLRWTRLWWASRHSGGAVVAVDVGRMMFDDRSIGVWAFGRWSWRDLRIRPRIADAMSVARALDILWPIAGANAFVEEQSPFATCLSVSSVRANVERFAAALMIREHGAIGEASTILKWKGSE